MILVSFCNFVQIPLAAFSKTWVWGGWFAGNKGSNSAGGMDYVSCVMYCQADHSSGGVLINVVCLSVISKSQR